MPNRFLRLMDERGERSVPALKRLYRAACKRVHPDAAAGSRSGMPFGGQAFLTIRAEYEEALAALAAPAGRVIDGLAPAREEARPARKPAWRGGTESRGGAGPASGGPAGGEPGDSGPGGAESAGRGAARGPRGREPAALAAFRDACARFGASAEAAGTDPYRWVPTVEAVTELLVLAHAVTGERLAAELGGLETALSAAIARRAELLRYPGIMTRIKMLYLAFSLWSAWRDGRSAADLAACRTRLLDLEDPAATLVRSQAVADVIDSFPGAARFLRLAWGISGDELGRELNPER